MSIDPNKELEQVHKSAKTTILVGVGVIVTWLLLFNIISEDMSPVLAFFKVLDGINDLFLGLLLVVFIGLGIVAVFTLTNLFTQTITNLYSMRILEDLIRDHLFTGEYRVFFYKLIHFNELPTPSTPFPRYVSSSLIVFAYHYAISWFYLVVFSECLYFAAWSAGVYLDLYPETINTIPLFAIAVPFTARLMAYFKYPYAEEYAAFIPGILFMVMLLLTFVMYMGGNFQFLLEDIYTRQELPYFAKGTLFWKFMLDGVRIAFYPLLGEMIFLYLMYHNLQSNNPLPNKNTQGPSKDSPTDDSIETSQGPSQPSV